MTDDENFVRRLVRSKLLSIPYHQQELGRENKRLALTRELLARAGLSVSDSEAIKTYDGSDDLELDSISAVEDYAVYLVSQALQSRRWHETELHKAHIEAAWIKALVLRGQYEFSLDEIAEEARARFAAGEGRDRE